MKKEFQQKQEKKTFFSLPQFSREKNKNKEGELEQDPTDAVHHDHIMDEL